MSRAIILIAQARFLKRPLTVEETNEVLRLWAELAGGERVYIPAPTAIQPSLFCDIANLRENGWSIRKIARKLGVSKSQVHRELSQNSALVSGQDLSEPTHQQEA